jgi:MFS family permease
VFDTIGDRLFPALKKRDFRLYWFGQCVSLIGTWMQNVGQSWLVLELTGSPAKLGIVSAVQFLPIMLLSLFAGPFVDRLPKRKVLIATQSSLLVLALALATITALGIAQYWMILILALLLGFVNLVDVPTRQAYVIELCGRETLMNAVSLNSASFNLARIVGPAVAGILMEAIGIAPCFFLNALSFAAVIAALAAIRARPTRAASRVEGMRDVLSSARDGLAYIAARREIVLPLVLLSALSTFVINFNVLVPTFSRGPLGRGASGYGFLMTSLGLGSFAAAISLAARSGRGPSRLRIYGGAVGMCIALAVCGLQRNYALTCLLLAVVGFCTISLTASANATVQLASDDEHRGRVMSVYALVFGGVTPIGALYAGALTDAAGPATCMVISGAIGLASTIAVALAAVRRSRSARPPGPDRFPVA